VRSAITVSEEIFDNDEASQRFCSIAASGEAQGGLLAMAASGTAA
jgi:hypothetical protein